MYSRDFPVASRIVSALLILPGIAEGLMYSHIIHHIMGYFGYFIDLLNTGSKTEVLRFSPPHLEEVLAGRWVIFNEHTPLSRTF